MKVESNMLPLGTIAPHFELSDVVSGQTIKLNGSHPCLATVILFICNHCPYVKHINSKLIQVANEYLKQNIRFIAISSNDSTAYPDDSPENMRITAKTIHYPFPYLYDETQEIARAYQAACTPDFYIFDKTLALVYRGQFDDSRPGNNIEVTGKSLSGALDCLLKGMAVSDQQKPSLGCNIKWK